MARRQNPKIERTLKRTSSLRLVKQTFLIVCEGEITEPEYFNSFRLTSANVKAIGKGMNTISLVKEAIAIRDIEKRRNRNYDQCWVVFDKDDFTDSDFNVAIQMAQANGLLCYAVPGLTAHLIYIGWWFRSFVPYVNISAHIWLARLHHACEAAVLIGYILPVGVLLLTVDGYDLSRLPFAQSAERSVGVERQLL